MEKDTATLVQALVALMVILGIAMGMVYWVTATSYNKKIETIKSSYSERFDELAKEVAERSKEVSQIEEERFWCTDCHIYPKVFHTPRNITILANEKNRPPRVCVHCHGFSIHTIHKKKLDSGQLQCQRCHFVEGKLIKPKPRKGDILVCQQCHWDGNYIEIHIEHGKATCLNCHVGGVFNVHKNTQANAQPELIEKANLSEVDLSVINIVP
jgi:Zn finger protein HypA/HybF involved in hydrogenase expression